MSLRHVKHVLDACERIEAPPTMRHVLVVCAFYADATTGSMAGGTGYLSRKTGLCRRSVERAMAQAGKRGLVKIKRRGKSSDQWQTTIYTLRGSDSVTLGGSDSVTLGVATLSAKGSGTESHSLKRQTRQDVNAPDGRVPPAKRKMLRPGEYRNL